LKNNIHTFVILAYNRSDYLKKCIESVLNQSVKSEILIYTSTPNSHIGEIADTYGINLFIKKGHINIADDWNNALDSANTKYVTLAHQDDIYFQDYAKIFLQYAGKFPDSAIYFSDYCELKKNNKCIKYNINLIIKKLLLLPFYIKKSISSKILKKSVLMFGTPISCPSVMYNKHLLPDFRFNPTYAVSLDWEAWLRLSGSSQKFTFIKKILVAHRIHGESETARLIKSGLRNREDTELFKNLWSPKIAGILSKIYSYSAKTNRQPI
jgi:glycosyltransferase involved in cell wall biosynthesis